MNASLRSIASPALSRRAVAPTKPRAPDPRAEAAKRPAGQMLHAGNPSAFVLVHSHDVALVCWQRSLTPGLQRWLDALPLGDLRGGQAVLPLSRVRAAARALLDTWPGGQGRALLARDIEGLADRFAAVARCSWLRLRLEVVSGDACRLFHVDYVPQRLVTTYLGAGTEYLPPEAVALDERGEVQLDLGRLQRMPAGHVALFRGIDERQPTAPLILHRSPPIAGTGERRLLLVIDAAASPAGEP